MFLRVEMIFHNVDARVTRAVAADAGTRNFRQSVNIVRDDSRFLLDELTHPVGPRFRAEDSDAQFRFFPVIADLLRVVDDVQEVARRACDRAHAKVADEHKMTRRVAPRRRNDRAAAALAPVVQTETAREKTVPVTHLKNVCFVDSEHRKTTRHAF